MKKFAALMVVILAFSFFITGCGNNGSNHSTEQSYSSTYKLNRSEQKLLNTASVATDTDSVQEILSKNNSPEFQVKLAKLENPIVKETLLQYSNLAPEALVLICQNPTGININNNSIYELFINRIQTSNLLPEQELKIASANVGPSYRAPILFGLTARTNLTPETLVYLCKNQKQITNLDGYAFTNFFQMYISTLDLTPEQEVQILDTGNPEFILSLLRREHLSSQCLMGILMNPHGIDFLETPNEFLLVNALNRVPLTDTQKFEALYNTPINSLVIKQHLSNQALDK